LLGDLTIEVGLQLFVSACGRFEGMPDGCYTYYLTTA
jgi:hypothetical protein